MNQGLSSLFWFVAVIAAIPLILWLLKRSQLVPGSVVRGRMRSVGVLPLSNSQRIVTVEVGTGEERRWLVLGVTPQQITTLYTLTPDEESQTPTAPPQVTFSQLLARMKGDKGNDAR